jgi:hypothetical protein
VNAGRFEDGLDSCLDRLFRIYGEFERTREPQGLSSRLILRCLRCPAISVVPPAELPRVFERYQSGLDFRRLTSYQNSDREGRGSLNVSSPTSGYPESRWRRRSARAFGQLACQRRRKQRAIRDIASGSPIRKCLTLKANQACIRVLNS